MTIHRYSFPDSSVLASCEYDDKEHELTINFLNGRGYIYKEVSYNTYEDLINSKSAGRHFANIKGSLKLK